MDKFDRGQYVYIVENNRWVRKATVISHSGGFYTLGFLDGGMTRLRESRVFATEEEAKAEIPAKKPPEPEKKPYDPPRTHHLYT